MSTAEAAPQPIYRRVLLKLSGEALMGKGEYGLEPETVKRLAQEIKSVHEQGIQLCLVIGGGNIFRGVSGAAAGMERASADYMGMLATVINSLALQSTLELAGVPTRVLSAIPMALPISQVTPTPSYLPAAIKATNFYNIFFKNKKS